MTVKRIVANLSTDRIDEMRAFYADLFGLETVMDHGWIVTLASDRQARVQIAIATEGGSGTPVPDISIEVDDVDAIHAAAQAAGHEICHSLTDEPWGVRRFFLRDPGGRIVNVLSHLG